MDENQFEKEFMEENWKNPDRDYQKPIVEDTIKQFANFLKENNITGKLLDIGCGSGKNSVYFTKQGFDVTAFDFTEEALKISKKLAEENNVKINFNQADVTKKYNFGKFDVILDCGCLHHIRDKYWNAYINNLLNASKPGTIFYLHGFSEHSHKLGFIEKGNNEKYRNGHYTKLFLDKEIEESFGKYFEFIKNHEYTALNGKFIVKVWYMKKK